jgi:hypothetical protein
MTFEKYLMEKEDQVNQKLTDIRKMMVLLDNREIKLSQMEMERLRDVPSQKLDEYSRFKEETKAKMDKKKVRIMKQEDTPSEEMKMSSSSTPGSEEDDQNNNPDN